MFVLKGNLRLNRFLRGRRIFIVIICLLFFVLAFFHYYTNAGDLIFFYFLPDSQVLPLSIQCNAGRLGNQMCTYASLYGLSALNRRQFSSLSCNLQHLKPYFQGLSAKKSIDYRFYFKWNPWTLHSYLKDEDAAIPANSNFIQGYEYPCSYTFFDHVQDHIRREFKFSEDLQQHAQNVLRKANIQHLNNVTYIGVHVRRGDYQERWLNAFGGVAVNMEYFQKAVMYFRNKYRPIIFILISDDRTWCIKNLSGRFGFYVAEEAPTPAHDLSILANCNHTVMSYGTFGFWGAYLAGGEVLYFDKFLKPNTTFTNNKFVFNKMYPPRWKGIVTIKSSVFENITYSEDKMS